VKNPVFKAQVDALFEKTAIGHDPHAVLAAMPHAQSGDLRRGLALMSGAHGAASGAGDILGAGYHGVSKLVDPTGPPGFFSRGLASAGDFVTRHPQLAISAAALAPILGRAFGTSQQQHQDELMNAYADPSRTITASLEEFLEKKAELYSMTKEAAKAGVPGWVAKPILQDLARRAARSAGNVTRAEANRARAKAQEGMAAQSREQAKRFQQASQQLKMRSEKATEDYRTQHGKDMKAIGRAAAGAVKRSLPGFWEHAGTQLVEGLGKGIGTSFGGVLVGLAAHGIGTGVDALRDHFSHEPKRKALVENLLRSDPVLSDAIERHPDSKAMVVDSYGTMVRFAPALSLDVNAVRSFLREAVLGGSGVNYATIKNLVDTEKSIAEAKPQYGGR